MTSGRAVGSQCPWVWCLLARGDGASTDTNLQAKNRISQMSMDQRRPAEPRMFADLTQRKSSLLDNAWSPLAPPRPCRRQSITAVDLREVESMEHTASRLLCLERS